MGFLDLLGPFWLCLAAPVWAVSRPMLGSGRPGVLGSFRSPWGGTAAAGGGACAGAGRRALGYFCWCHFLVRTLAEALPAWRHPTEQMTALHAAVACAVRAVGKCVEDGSEGAAAAAAAAAAGQRRAGTAAERVEVDACRVVRLLASVVRCSSLAKPTGR